MYSNLIQSFFINYFLNKIILAQKTKFLNIFFLSWKFFKKKKLKPTILFFLILNKLKPIFKIYSIKPSKKIKKRKKFLKIVYFPKTLNPVQGFIIAINWFLLPFFINKKYKYNYNCLIENCFLFFLDKKKFNLALKKKKAHYVKSMSLYQYFRFF